jgi:hypothetical protein
VWKFQIKNVIIKISAKYYTLLLTTLFMVLIVADDCCPVAEAPVVWHEEKFFLYMLTWFLFLCYWNQVLFCEKFFFDLFLVSLMLSIEIRLAA